MSRSIAVLVVLALALASVALADGRTSVLVLVPHASPGEVRSDVETLERAGLIARHVFPEGAIIAERDAGVPLDGRALPADWVVVEGPLAPSSRGPDGPVPSYVERLWNVNYHGMRAEYGVPAASPAFVPPAGDTFVAPPYRARGPDVLAESAPRLAPSTDPGNPCGAADDNTSDFLSGRVTVAVFTPESAGDGENWTTARLDQVKAEVQEGMNDLAAAVPLARLTFFYRWNDRCPTSIEPITMNHADAERIYVPECLTSVGVPADSTNYASRARDYDRAARDEYGAHWGFSMFIPDSYNDPDGTFADGATAYAGIGGPYLVMTYDNGGTGIAQLNRVAQHETGHIFYAMDEYSGCSCTARCGYLDGENQDCVAGCALNVTCAMRSDPTTSECVYSQAQMGVNDTDGDGTADVRDTFPDSALDAPAGAAVDATPTFTGSAVDAALANRNEHCPYSTKGDITLNTIAGVEYRVDGGAWSPAAPGDGAFDFSQEGFTFTTVPLGLGAHTVEVRATNSVGNVEPPPYASRVVTVEAGSRLDVKAFVLQDANPREGNGNGGADPGELITMPLTIENNGSRAESRVTVTITSTSPEFQVLTGSLAYPDVPVGSSQVSPAPHFRFAVAATAACGARGAFTVTMTSANGTWVQQVPVFVGAQPLFFDDAERGDVGFVPDVVVAAGANSWARNGYRVASGAQAWEYANHASHDIDMSNELGYYAEGTLTSPYVTLPASGSIALSFAHSYDFEYEDPNEHDRQDGGWVEIDSGRNWGTLAPAGGYPLRWDGCHGNWDNTIWSCFWVNGANDHANAHAGQAAFLQDGPAGFNTDTFALDAWRGRTVRFRFHVSCTNGDWEPHNGWWIDDIAIRDAGAVCAPFDAPVPEEVSPAGNPARRALVVRKDGGNVRLDWDWAAGGARYSLYRGTMTFRDAAVYDHACEAAANNLAGVTATFAAPAGNVYWLAVAENVDNDEGPYGSASNGSPIPPASTRCP